MIHTLQPAVIESEVKIVKYGRNLILGKFNTIHAIKFMSIIAIIVLIVINLILLLVADWWRFCRRKQPIWLDLMTHHI